MARHVLSISGMTTSTQSTSRNPDRSVNVILGPPGLFIGLTLAALIAGFWIARSADADAAPRPAPAQTAHR